MTVGEKIQFYRKKIGLSQEDLGKKLLVSRQTVSLWEIDKTLPTVDNLIRLKEIFGVSIDDILTDSDITEAPFDVPKEKYQFDYSASELKDIFKISVYPVFKRALLFAICTAAAFIFFIMTSAPDAIIGIIVGLFLSVAIYNAKWYLTFNKAWKKNEDRILECQYTFKLYDGFLFIQISKNNEAIKWHKIYFDDLELLHNTNKYFIFKSANQSLIIKKENLNKESVFYSYYKWNPNKVDESLIKNKWSAISTVLIIFSILSIPGALIGIAILSGINNLFTENMWIFFLFTPIPIASIVIGSYLKSKGIYKYQKNIVVGIIMTALLCIYGSFSFIFPDIYSHSDEPILQIEKNIGIDIPSHSRINTQDWTKGTQSVSRGYIFYTSDVYFESDAADKFEEQIKNDGKWISDVPTEMVGITSPFADLQSYDYIIIYNTVTQDINKLPKENGTYRFVNVLYDCVSNKMKIVEYEIEYVK